MRTFLYDLVFCKLLRLESRKLSLFPYVPLSIGVENVLPDSVRLESPAIINTGNRKGSEQKFPLIYGKRISLNSIEGESEKVFAPSFRSGAAKVAPVLNWRKLVSPSANGEGINFK